MSRISPTRMAYKDSELMRRSVYRGTGLSLLSGLRVGLLGGSFNPAHEGHRHISLVALRRLRLDYVVWMLSPQNPLKSRAEIADLQSRIERAAVVAGHPRILVSDIEHRLGTVYTADTLIGLRNRFPSISFVWLMGGDNLVQFPRWNRWTRIMETMPVAIVDRPGYGVKAQLGKASQRYRRFRLRPERAASLPDAPPPAWIYLHAKLNPLSASAIRARIPQGMSWSDLA